MAIQRMLTYFFLILRTCFLYTLAYIQRDFSNIWIKLLFTWIQTYFSSVYDTFRVMLNRADLNSSWRSIDRCAGASCRLCFLDQHFVDEFPYCNAKFLIRTHNELEENVRSYAVIFHIHSNRWPFSDISPPTTWLSPSSLFYTLVVSFTWKTTIIKPIFPHSCRNVFCFSD